MERPNVQIVIGGQYGSEGKGAFIYWLTEPVRCGPIVVVRTGGPNAGHSVLHEGEHIKMQQIPCAWHNPQAKLLIGPGALIDEAQLAIEIDLVQRVQGKSAADNAIIIDPNAVIIEQKHRETEQGLVKGIGSTGHGIGGATAARVMREAQLAGEYDPLQRWVDSVPDFLHKIYGRVPILVESTQGFGLSLTRSGLYPFTTSRDITPAQVMNDAGIPHNWRTHVTGVFRTHPIRVAGNSGPMFGGELSWDQLTVRSRGYIQEPERTTVTNKVRRISEWDSALAREACKHLQPNDVYLSFFDYVHPEIAGSTDINDLDSEIIAGSIQKFQDDLSAPVGWIGTGFGSIIDLR